MNNIQSYTFATSKRPLYITIDRQNYQPYTAVTGGTFTTDETWFGPLHVLGSVAFDNNSVLTVAPSAILQFAEAKNLSIKAGSKIIAEGTVQDSIYFTAESGSAQHPWGTFYVSSSHNRFQYCVVEYGNWGLKFYNANGATDNSIEHSDLQYNDQGVRIERNEVVVKNNTIHDNRHGIVTINNTEVEFQGNHIYDNDRDGIYSTSNNYLQLYGNVIETNGLGGTNSRNGIYTRNGDNIELGDVNGIIWQGYNTIRDNVATEVYAGYGDPVVEIIEASIHDDTGDEVYNYTGNPSIVDYTTWWGEYPPDGSQIVGDVSIHSPKTSEPNWEGTTQSTSSLPKSETPDHPVPPTPALIAHLKQLIWDNIGSPQADSALVRLNFYVRHDYHTNALDERGHYGAFLNQLYTGRPQTAEGQRALQYLIAWQTVNNQLPEALGLTQIALDNSPASQHAALAEKLFYLQVYTGDLEAAQATLAEFPVTTAAQTATREFLTDYLAEAQAAAAQDEALAKKSAPSEDTPALPTTVVLRPNYPNPFNPTTTIVYAVPTAQHVHIEVFDMQGHLVQTLLNKQVPAGYHTVDWNGTNQTGTSVASGLYLYRLRTSSAIRVKKMMLIR